MKRTFAATVVGLGDTDTSGYTAGAHTISLAIDGAAPLGPAPRRVDLPIFTREESRELGALYRTENAVRVIVETGDAPRDVIRWIVTDGNDAQECADGEFGVEVNGIPYVYYKGGNEQESPWRDVLYRPVQKREFGETIRRHEHREAPPLVNGRPSCCETASGAIRHLFHRFSDPPRRWRITNNVVEDIYVDYCPFCGARLPEVPT